MVIIFTSSILMAHATRYSAARLLKFFDTRKILTPKTFFRTNENKGNLQYKLNFIFADKQTFRLDCVVKTSLSATIYDCRLAAKNIRYLRKSPNDDDVLGDN